MQIPQRNRRPFWLDLPWAAGGRAAPTETVSTGSGEGSRILYHSQDCKDKTGRDLETASDIGTVGNFEIHITYQT